MRPTIALLMLALATPAPAQPAQKPTRPAKSAAEPKELGEFGDWIAATHQESGQTVCYAFVPAKTSLPSVPKRGEVILTVTERPTGRDWVAISAGFPYRKDAAVTVQVDITYDGRQVVVAGYDFSPIKRAVDSIGGTFATSVASLITLVATAVPWLPVIALLVWGARRGLRRWRTRGT